MRRVIALLHPAYVRIDGTGGFGDTRCRRRRRLRRRQGFHERWVLGGICVVGLDVRARSWRASTRAGRHRFSSAAAAVVIIAVNVVVIVGPELILSFNGTYRAHHRSPLLLRRPLTLGRASDTASRDRTDSIIGVELRDTLRP